jgi:hypothetical protein
MTDDAWITAVADRVHGTEGCEDAPARDMAHDMLHGGEYKPLGCTVGPAADRIAMSVAFP